MIKKKGGDQYMLFHLVIQHSSLKLVTVNLIYNSYWSFGKNTLKYAVGTSG